MDALKRQRGNAGGHALRQAESIAENGTTVNMFSKMSATERGLAVWKNIGHPATIGTVLLGIGRITILGIIVFCGIACAPVVPALPAIPLIAIATMGATPANSPQATEPGVALGRQCVYAKREDNIRAGPGTNHKILRKTTPLEPLTFVSKGEGWYRLDTPPDAAEAWVHESVVFTAKEMRARRRAKLAILDWNWIIRYGYVTTQGRVRNVSQEPLRNVVAVVCFFTESDKFITRADAIIDYNPILPGQVSPFKVTEIHNPAMKTARLEFKDLFGGKLEAYGD